MKLHTSLPGELSHLSAGAVFDSDCMASTNIWTFLKKTFEGGLGRPRAWTYFRLGGQICELCCNRPAEGHRFIPDIKKHTKA